MSGTSSADSINNRAKNVIIDAGKGNDTVTTYGNNVSVSGGAGNDSIRSTGGTKVTLHGGDGNDTLTGSSDPIEECSNCFNQSESRQRVSSND